MTPTSEHRDSELPPSHLEPRKLNESGKRRSLLPLVIAAASAGVLLTGALMVRRAESKTNKVALADAPKLVTAVLAKRATFRPSRAYVGTLKPWIEAKIGPQLVSAYVDTVLVRPGAVVKKGDVLATLDCRNANAMSRAIAMQARALEARQQAVAHEAARVENLLDGGFVSPNEAEQKTATSEAEQAQLLATKAKLLGSSLEVNDCVLRAPFDGEIATRTADPGAFVRPGSSIVSIVDRSTVRIVADAPEVDFDVVAPGTEVNVHVLATGRDLVATIARRAPAADVDTRTVHFEMDVADPKRELPVGTTADLRIEVGEAEEASQIPLYAAVVRGSKANVFVIDGDIAHKKAFRIKGEREGMLFVDGALKPGTKIVTEGRALLDDNDKVSVTVEQPDSRERVAAPSAAASAAPARTP